MAEPAAATHDGAVPESMDLSETSRAGAEQHAAALVELEIGRRARTIFASADVQEVKNQLREMGQPVTLFGEGPAERRERLKRMLATAEVRKALMEGMLKMPAEASAALEAVPMRAPAQVLGAPGAALAEKKEKFYTPGSEELAEARQFIAKYSFERAQRRLRAERVLAESRRALQAARPVLDPDAMEEDDPASAAARAEDMHAARVYKNMKRSRPVMSQPGDDRPLTCCALSHDSALLATGSWSCVVKVWDAATAELRCVFRGHKERVVGVAWHPASGLHADAHHGSSAATHGYHAHQADRSVEGAHGIFVTGSVDGTAKLWKTPEAALQSVPLSRPARAGDAAPEGVAAEHRDLVENGVREVGTFTGHTMRLSNVGFHPSGRYVGTSSFDHTWRLWDVETQKELLLQEGHSKEVYALAFHGDGSLVASGDLGGIGRVWDLRSGNSVFVLRGHTKQLLALDFSPNGFHIASGSEDHTSIIWDLRQQRPLYTIPAHSGLIPRVKFSPISGEVLVTCSYDGTVKTWSARDWSPLGVLTGHEGKVTGVDISRDDMRLHSVSFDRTIKVWEAGPDV